MMNFSEVYMFFKNRIIAIVSVHKLMKKPRKEVKPLNPLWVVYLVDACM